MAEKNETYTTQLTLSYFNPTPITQTASNWRWHPLECSYSGIILTEAVTAITLYAFKVLMVKVLPLLVMFDNYKSKKIPESN